MVVATVDVVAGAAVHRPVVGDGEPASRDDSSAACPSKGPTAPTTRLTTNSPTTTTVERLRKRIGHQNGTGR